ncbi:MAG: hypothetical protein ACQERB_02960 [Promethearchaeati archaeon]
MADIKLKINEKEIPLNEIMDSMLNNLILGYLKSIKGIPKEIKTINIEINL